MSGGASVVMLTDELILLAAQAAHEVNRVYCLALGDSSQVAWDDAPTWQQDSALAGARFHHDNPAAGPSASHESWLAQKVADGWVYGETKDVDAKTHPCMVPFDRLPFSQQAKDVLFQTTVWGVFTHYENEG